LPGSAATLTPSVPFSVATALFASRFPSCFARRTTFEDARDTLRNVSARLCLWSAKLLVITLLLWKAAVVRLNGAGRTRRVRDSGILRWLVSLSRIGEDLLHWCKLRAGISLRLGRAVSSLSR
jgi:hypothetical protein